VKAVVVRTDNRRKAVVTCCAVHVRMEFGLAYSLFQFAALGAEGEAKTLSYEPSWLPRWKCLETETLGERGEGKGTGRGGRIGRVSCDNSMASKARMIHRTMK
jgi:hypothetical protein